MRRGWIVLKRNYLYHYFPTGRVLKEMRDWVGTCTFLITTWQRLRIVHDFFFYCAHVSTHAYLQASACFETIFGHCCDRVDLSMKQEDKGKDGFKTWHENKHWELASKSCSSWSSKGTALSLLTIVATPIEKQWVSLFGYFIYNCDTYSLHNKQKVLQKVLGQSCDPKKTSFLAFLRHWLSIWKAAAAPFLLYS